MRYRIDQAPQVGRQRPALDVAPVDLDLRGPQHVAVERLGVLRTREQLLLVAVGHRCGAGDAGAHAEHHPVLAGEQVGEAGDVGPRTDQAHLAAQDVDQLRQLVDLEPAHPRPGAGDPRVAGRGDGGAAPRAHRADLHHFEQLAVLADAGLTEEPVVAGRDRGDHPGNGHDRREHHQHDGGDHDVEGALQRALAAGERHRPTPGNRGVAGSAPRSLPTDCAARRRGPPGPSRCCSPGRPPPPPGRRSRARRGT